MKQYNSSKGKKEPLFKKENKNINNNKFSFFVISFIIHFILIIIAAFEFTSRVKNNYSVNIFDYLSNLFILFVFMTSLLYMYYGKEDFFKGLIYYPFCTFYWVLADFLSIFLNREYNKNIKKWNIGDILKTSKFLLMIILLFINIYYIKFVYYKYNKNIKIS